MHFLEITHESLIISNLDFSKYTPNSTLNLSKILKLLSQVSNTKDVANIIFEQLTYLQSAEGVYNLVLSFSSKQ